MEQRFYFPNLSCVETCYMGEKMYLQENGKKMPNCYHIKSKTVVSIFLLTI